MKISQNKQNGKLWLSQKRYIKKVLNRFNMSKVKEVSTPLADHFRLGIKQCLTSEKNKEDMKKVPYVSIVGSLMYVMICTMSDIAHTVGVVSRHLFNPGKEHWNAVKWILRYLKRTLDCVYVSVMVKLC